MGELRISNKLENTKDFNPLFSVVITLYNHEEFIIRALESVKNQTYQDFEVIVVDDGSTDNSSDIASDFCKNNGTVKWRYYKKPNKGLTSSRNFGIDKAKGKYVAYLDSDDEFEPNLLKECAKVLSDYDDVEIINIGWRHIKEDKTENNGSIYIDKIIYPNKMLKNKEKCNIWDIATSASWMFIYKLDHIIKHRCKNNSISYLEDYCYVPEAIFSANKLCTINKYLYKYYNRKDSMHNQKPMSIYLLKVIMYVSCHSWKLGFWYFRQRWHCHKIIIN